MITQGKISSGATQIPVQQKNTSKTATLSQTDTIYGELSEKVIRPVYEGVDTPSFDITVDNTNKTISGDVKLGNFLGTTTDKAYPGHLGERNYQLILECEKSVKDLLIKYRNFYYAVLDLVNGCNVDIKELNDKTENKFDIITSDIDNYVNNFNEELASVNSRITDINSKLLHKIDAETQTRINEIASLSRTLQEEIERSTERDQQLSNELSQLDSKILSTVEPKLEELDNKIEKIQDETLSQINIKLEELQNNVTAELTKINENLTELDDKLNNDIAVAIETEKTRAENAESQLRTQITTLNSFLSNLEFIDGGMAPVAR